MKPILSVIVPTNGRTDCMKSTMDVFLDLWPFSAFDTHVIIVDDSQNNQYNGWLRSSYEPLGYDIVRAEKSLGFHGAIQRAWDEIHPNTDYVLHLEDDFTFVGHPPISEMAQILVENPHLAQVALKRQPWNEQEKAAGGIIEQWPDEYTDCTNGTENWCEHTLFFTTNPCIYRYELTKFGWPQQARSEEAFSNVCREAGLRFAFYGHKFDPPRVIHIGDKRTGTGY